MLKVTIIIPAAENGRRLDAALTVLLAAADETSACGMVISRSKVERWISEGRVQSGGRTVIRPSQTAAAGQIFEVSIPLEVPLHLAASREVPFGIIFEDSEILVIDKPAGVVVHPGAGRSSDTLVNGLVAYLGENLPRIGDGLRPGIVHRLDKDTSGIMVIAKSEKAYHFLAAQFKPPRTIERRYLAASIRLPRPLPGMPEGVIELPIGRHPVHRTKMAVIKEGRPSRSAWQALEVFGCGVLLELKIETGRTHQIRVHLAAVHAPILGDPLYGPALAEISPTIRPAVKQLGRQALHAYRLSFLHPLSRERVEFSAALPDDFKQLLDSLRGGSGSVE